MSRYAAVLAKELAKLKISSRLTEQEQDTRPVNTEETEIEETPAPAEITVKTVKANMYVEDAVSAQGPIVIEVNPQVKFIFCIYYCQLLCNNL